MRTSPRRPNACTVADLASKARLHPTAVVSDNATGKMTLVLADTSGFHFRGVSADGATRWQSQMRGPMVACPASQCKGEVTTCGAGCLPRRNVFHCEQFPADC